MIQALGFLTLIIAVGCMAIAWLANHGKLKWSDANKQISSFWGSQSWRRKYKMDDEYNFFPAPTTYYYKLFNLKYKERFPLSATFLVFTTDGMHLMQFCYHIFLALSLWLFSGVSFWWFWPLIVVAHAAFYRLFSK